MRGTLQVIGSVKACLMSNLPKLTSRRFRFVNVPKHALQAAYHYQKLRNIDIASGALDSRSSHEELVGRYESITGVKQVKELRKIIRAHVESLHP
mmetsp:Transcript_60386/g.119700  ORF Transcript_60386/g.119700 Transcript_60386/m.119700 type:complete len:95 (+) Transcript_60386:265-549(+)